MENFYRMMRKKTKILMQGSDPIGGVWNLNKETHKNLPKYFAQPNPIQLKSKK